MAMDLGGAKGGVKSEINVTPLCDVMLVLLIIMMIIAPLLQQGITVALPKAQNTVDKPEVQGQTVIAIGKDKTMYVNARPVQESEMTTRVTELLENQKEKIVLIKADEEVEYSAVMAAMDQLRQAGIEDIGLITLPKNQPGASGGGQ
jgi:biopolymer transport protein TolR